jgi:uncharacterized LabA/DUF88 family protein
MRSKKSKKLILIDYQNIQDLTGLRQLGRSAVCEVFFSPNQKIKGKRLQEFEYATEYATIGWNEVNHPGRNAADMRIVFKLRELLDKYDEFYILSKDKDFDSIVAFVRTHPGKRIRRIENFSPKKIFKPLR